MCTMSEKIPLSFGTHDGTFHADEVTACALLLLFELIKKDRINRTRDPAKLETCEYVCDVGGIYDPSRKLFDHHQIGYQGPMSSAGMILLYLKDQGVIAAHEYDFFNHVLIIGVDSHDNGKDSHIVGFCSYSNVISNFTPIRHNIAPEIQDRAFLEAVEFALGHLSRLWERHNYTISCKQIVAECMAKNKECLLFDEGIPWLESFFELDGGKHPALFVIMPAGEHWKLRAIPPNYDERMKVRFPLPKEWAGLLEEDLKNASGIPGAIFCHKGRFISVWKTREDALKALQYTIARGRN
jgi:uncharacterized UPF0160 family protein